MPFRSVYVYDAQRRRNGIESDVLLINSSYVVGDSVVVRPVTGNCMERWSPGTVTALINDWSVEIDGVPRHRSHVRRIQA